MPRGGTLTPRRFLMLGLLLGSADGFESLHDLLELARSPEIPTASPEIPTGSPDELAGSPDDLELARSSDEPTGGTEVSGGGGGAGAEGSGGGGGGGGEGGGGGVGGEAAAGRLQLTDNFLLAVEQAHTTY